MSELPQHWKVIRVDEAGSVQLGRQRSPEHHTGPHMRPYLRVANVYENRIDTSDVLEMNFAPPEAERFGLKYGDILLNEGQSRELVGRPAMYRDEVPGACFQNTLLRFRAYDHVHPEYALSLFRHYLKNGAFQNVCRWTTNIAHLGAARFAAMPFPLPPLAEQKRIADKLDRLLAAVDTCKARLDAIPAILKRFRQSVLAAATSGELTEEWRVENQISLDGWRTLRFENVCREITVGFVGKMSTEYRDDGVPFLRSLNVRPFRFDPDQLRYISAEFHRKIAKSVLRPGDVVVVRSGAPGQCCVIPAEVVEGNCSDLVIVRPDAALVPEYACVFINSEVAQRYVRSEQVGVAQAHFNVGSMKLAPLKLPSLNEQHEIARQVGFLLSEADRLELQVSMVRREMERLTQGLLAKAFGGELVSRKRTGTRSEESRELVSNLSDILLTEHPHDRTKACLKRTRGLHGNG